MRDQRVLFVVGAGASTEFGLPVGRALLTQLSSVATRASALNDPNVKIPPELRRALQSQAQKSGSLNWGEEFQKLSEVALWISRNAQLAPSIDNLLHSHRHDVNTVSVGKLMIAHCLLTAEAKSVLAPNLTREGDLFAFLKQQKPISYNGEIKAISATDSWLARLFWLLAEESSFGEFVKRLSNIDFVCFNYDRCIEHYILNASISYFKLAIDQAQKVQSAINIIHPYGFLGDLRIEGGTAVGFGEQADLSTVASRIRTFTEGSEVNGIHDRITERLYEADFVAFLGFGFLSLNLELIFGGTPVFEPSEIAATSLGLSQSSTQLIGEMLKQKHRAGRDLRRSRGGPTYAGELNLRFHNFGCAQLLDHYHHFLRKI